MFSKEFLLTKQLINFTNTYKGLKLFGSFVKSIVIHKYEISYIISPLNLSKFTQLLKYNIFYQCNQLSEICSIDYPNLTHRFKLVYNLLSVFFNQRFRVIIYTTEHLGIPTLSHIFNGANWQEREIWDMFGIFFEGHNDLRRILTDYGFSGFPLRKEFPLSGFSEIFYNDKRKLICYQKVSFSQEYRDFTIFNPWKPLRHLVN